MKEKKVWKILTGIIIVISIFLLIVWNSGVNKNTRYLENKLSDPASQGSGLVKDLFNIEYDKVYIFEPYQSKEKMEAQIGFKSYILKETVSEGMMNILFTKKDSPVAYLYGYPSNVGYNIELAVGEYTRTELNTMIYSGKSITYSGEAITYMNYTFDEEEILP